jgi:hypothetical protein
MLRFHERAPERIAEVITEYRENGRLVATVEQRHEIHALARMPADTGRIGRWRREMPPDEVAQFHAITGRTLVELGYD